MGGSPVWGCQNDYDSMGKALKAHEPCNHKKNKKTATQPLSFVTDAGQHTIDFTAPRELFEETAGSLVFFFLFCNSWALLKANHKNRQRSRSARLFFRFGP